MSHKLVKEADHKMEKSLEAFQQEMGNIRTGRANAGLMDMVDVEAYGSRMKINQLGSVTVPDPHLIAIDLWDKSLMGIVEKAIMASSLGLNPSNDGRVIRVPIPPLSEERRKELVKVASRHLEEAKIAVRNVRRHTVDVIKKSQKDGEIPEDDAHKLTDELQKFTDRYIDRLDAAFKDKEADIMEV